MEIKDNKTENNKLRIIIKILSIILVIEPIAVIIFCYIFKKEIEQVNIISMFYIFEVINIATMIYVLKNKVIKKIVYALIIIYIVLMSFIPTVDIQKHYKDLSIPLIEEEHVKNMYGFDIMKTSISPME